MERSSQAVANAILDGNVQVDPVLAAAAGWQGALNV